MVERIFVPGNVASGKNSKVWTGKFLVHSKTARRYIKESKRYWELFKDDFLFLARGKKKPYRLEFQFIRGTRHHFDYHNVVQLPLDLMQEYEWIENDDSDNVIPSFIPYRYDKEKPGVFIRII